MGDGIRDDTDTIDDVMKAYLDWLEESEEVESAYRRWSIAPSTDTARAFADYVAALDREDRASAAYALAMRRTIVQYHSEYSLDLELRDAA
jgi:hypothetical protein